MPNVGKRDLRLRHVKSHATWDSSWDRTVTLLSEGKGSRGGCLSNLSRFAFANAIDSWFSSSDIVRCKNWFFTTSRVRRERWPLLSADDTSYSPIGVFQDFLPALISDNRTEREALRAMGLILKGVPTNRPIYGAELPHLAIAAIRQEFDQVHRRAEKVLAAGDEPFFEPDYRFFLALASGDRPGMQAEIAKLLTEDVLAKRENLESGYTQDLISTFAVIYAKLAWLCGYEIVINSPLVPAEWLPVAPLPEYKFPWNFPLTET